jgi:cytochrome c oxidase assembly protein subunit 15
MILALPAYLCAAMQSSPSDSAVLRSGANSGSGATPGTGATPGEAPSRAVAIWIYTGVAMLLVQVILGGITRLTGSGLSITEWNVGTGAIPPLNTAQWQDAFDKYQQTPQYRLLNSGFSLADYQFIFFWEWFHRFWARLVGVVFLVGFAWLLWKRKIRSGMVRPLIILFLLGALQGAVGWIMVLSGLTGDATYVQPTKLALHFVFALVLIVYTFWLGLELSVPRERTREQSPFEGTGDIRSGSSVQGLASSLGEGRAVASLRRWTVAILCVLFFQLLYGALMAGHKAANAAPTWPTINGDWVPPGLFDHRPLFEALAGSKIAVQFIHRTLAYCLLLMVLIWTGKAARLPATPDFFRPLRWLPLLLITTQILLGIGSLLTSPWIRPQHWVSFDWLAQFHQVTGLLFLLTMTGMLYLVLPHRRFVTP